MTTDSPDSLESRMRSVFTKVFADKIDYKPDLKRTDTKSWDSLKHVELMIALEAEFGIRMDGADATAMTGVPQVIEIVEGKLA